jgi:hypothetical protein
LQAAALFTFAQPVAGTHESSVHELLSSQFGGAPPTHAPPAHASLVVQALPSSHDVPSARAGPDTHRPVPELHASGPLHTLPSSVHTTAVF